MDASPTEICVAPVGASRDCVHLRTSRVGCAAKRFILFSFPCPSDHEREWPRYKVVFRLGNQCVECKKQQLRKSRFVQILFKQQH